MAAQLTQGLFLPRDSPVHRLPAAVKLLFLVAAGLTSPWWTAWPAAPAALVISCLLYPVARLSPAVLWSQLRPALPAVAAFGVLQWVLHDWTQGASVAASLASLILLAALVTLTTRTTDLIGVIERVLGPLRVVGVDPGRVSLLLSLGIRSVPVVVGLAQEVREAQYARSLSASPRAFAVPLLIRGLRQADAMGEALAARGVDD